MISATSISSGGPAAATRSFGTTAERVADIGTSLPSAIQVDLSSTAVQLIEDKVTFAANVAVLHASNESEKKVLDILV